MNDSLNDEPEKVNKDPYGEGWMIKMKMNAAGRGGQPFDRRRVRRFHESRRVNALRYIPNSPDERAEMLRQIGVDSIENFSIQFRKGLRLRGPLDGSGRAFGIGAVEEIRRDGGA